MDEITDISMEDSEELTNWFTDDELKTRVKNEAANLLKYNIGKRISRKANQKLARDLSDAMTISQLDNKKDIVVSEAKRGNKTVGLDWYLDSSPKRTERYSLGLDAALPTPKKMNFEPKTRDTGTSPRTTKGRPPAAAYRIANPTRASVGEMTNPIEY